MNRKRDILDRLVQSIHRGSWLNMIGNRMIVGGGVVWVWVMVVGIRVVLRIVWMDIKLGMVIEVGVVVWIVGVVLN